MSKENKVDGIVESVVKKFRERSRFGIVKYEKTLENNDSDDFLTHLQEELMDAVNYIEKIKSLRSKKAKDIKVVYTVVDNGS